MPLEKTTFPQVYLEQDVLDSAQDDWKRKDELVIIRSTGCATLTLDLLGIRGTGIVSIDLLRGCALVERDEAVEQVVACRIVVVTSLVIGEVVTHGRMRQLLRKQIDLVQKQNLCEHVSRELDVNSAREWTYDRGLDKPSRVADRVEQSQSLLHTIYALILVEHLVILAERDQEHQRGYVLEAVDPLLSLTPLPTNIEELVRQLAHTEVCLGNTSRLDTRPQDILIRG